MTFFAYKEYVYVAVVKYWTNALTVSRHTWKSLAAHNLRTTSPVVLNRGTICVSLGCRKLLHIIPVFLNVCAVRGSRCAVKDFEKKLFRVVEFCGFVREISVIRSEDHFYLERTDFGKEIDKKEREFR